ncbi:hypothetical protein XELAEV_18010316mg [Xenopus laevis]|uniref:Olfactory receptor n=1 Tax=Xenopus laevis TaxID=8355 RepID=A0A974I1L2_XENLA|nr:hypothetical protein XELAEV_18010316mg [Xenopus laevis]
MLVNQSFLADFVLLGFSVSEQFEPFLFTLFLCIYLLSLVCNFLIMTVVSNDLKLHSPMYLFISVFSFIEVCYTSVIFPRLLHDLCSEDKSISLSFCIAQFYFLFAFGSIENFLLASMAYDRYMAICNPLRYLNIMTQKMCMFLVLGSFLGGILAPLVPAAYLSVLSFCGSNHIDHFYCDFPPLVHLFCRLDKVLIVESLFFFLACVVILGNFIFIGISYGLVIATTVKISSSTGTMKTLSTCSSHLTVVGIFYGSIIFMYVRSDITSPTQSDKLVSLLYCVITPSLNPLIYGLRNEELKKALKRTWQRIHFSEIRIWLFILLNVHLNDKDKQKHSKIK